MRLFVCFAWEILPYSLRGKKGVNYVISAKAARVNAGLSQTQVAEHLHVSKSTVSRWETGSLPENAEIRQKLCKLYCLDQTLINFDKEREEKDDRPHQN